jgi:hypothetical protein
MDLVLSKIGSFRAVVLRPWERHYTFPMETAPSPMRESLLRSPRSQISCIRHGFRSVGCKLAARTAKKYQRRSAKCLARNHCHLSADVLPKECHSLFVPTGSEDLKRYKVLIRMRTALTREFGQLSSKLRLTPAAQVRLDRHVSSGVPWESANKQRNGKPWGESEVEQQ